MLCTGLCVLGAAVCFSVKVLEDLDGCWNLLGGKGTKGVSDKKVPTEMGSVMVPLIAEWPSSLRLLTSRRL